MTRTLIPAALLLSASTAWAFDEVSFQDPVLIGAEVAPVHQVELGDLDRNGLLDVVVCGDGGAGWYLRDLAGWTWVPGPAGACTALEVADMDRDGQLDVMTLEPGTDTVVHYLDSPTTWSTYPTDSGGFADTIQDFGIFDVNRDGWLDLHSHADTGNRFTQFAQGGRAEGFAWTGGGTDLDPGTKVQVGDFDHDGFTELAVLDTTTGVFQIDWGGAVQEDFGVLDVGAEDFLIHDLDQDGVAEVVWWSSGGALQMRESGGGWAYGCCDGMRGVAVGDFDHDGRQEFIGALDGQLRVEHEDYSAGAFLNLEQQFGAFTPTGAVGGLGGDLDADGDLDMVFYDDAGVYVATNDTPHVNTVYGTDYAISGTWSAPFLVLSGQLDHVLVDDLVVAGRDGDGLTALLTLDNASFPPDWHAHTITTRTVGPVGILVDLDRDGDLDVIAADDTRHLYGWENQNGGTTWVEHDLTMLDVQALAAADIDMDGDPDLIVAAGGSVTVLENGPAWSPTPNQVLLSGANTISGLDTGDIDRDGDPDVLILENSVAPRATWIANPLDDLAAWPAHEVHSGTNISTRAALLDADHDGWLDVLFDDQGTLTIKTGGGDPTTTPWATVSTLATGAQLTSAPIDHDGDGVHEILVWDGTSVWTHGYDGRVGAWEAPVLVHDSLEAPTSMTAFLRVREDGVFEPVIAHAGASPGVTWTLGNVGTSVVVEAPPVPIDGVHITHPGSWVVAIPTLTYDAKPGDASVSPELIRIRASLGGSNATGATLAGLGDWVVWFDADGDGVLDPAIDTLVTAQTNPNSANLDLPIDLSDGVPALAPQTSGTWFVEFTPSLATTLSPAQELVVSLRDVMVATVPHGAGVSRSWSNTVMGTWTIGNTPPQVSTQGVQVVEGGDVVFDPLDLVSDADGDPFWVLGLVGQPLYGVAAEEGPDIRYTHDGSEAPEDFLLIDVTDGIETVPRVVLIEVLPSDDAPWADAGFAEGLEDRPLDVVPSGGDVDDVPVFEITVPPAHGQAVLVDNPDGVVVTVTPDPNHTGPDSFQFVVHGGAVTSAPATVSLLFLEDLSDDDDGDGILDLADFCPDVPDPLNIDQDLDGLGDVCDDDDDGDGIPDATDPCPTIPAPGAPGVDDPCLDDDDGDGVLDEVDLCPFDPDPAQDDLDGDGLGDACDADDDNDLVADTVDNCPATSNLDQGDVDGDGLGNACDDDDDDDGEPDVSDVCPWNADPAQEDLDGDGVGDACDGDADGDGAEAGVDCDDGDPAVQSEVTFFDDLDGDGFGDADSSFEACASAPPAGAVWDGTDNCPADANPDQSDIDADGLGDLCDPTPGALDGGQDTGQASAKAGDGNGGCGCDQTGAPGAWTLLPLLLLLRRRPTQALRPRK